MLCVPLHAPEGEEPVVEIESGARGAVDRGGKNDGGRPESVPIERSTRCCAYAGGAAEGAGRRVSPASLGLGELSEVSARLPSRNFRMGGQCEERGDANQAAGETNRVFGAQ